MMARPNFKGLATLMPLIALLSAGVVPTRVAADTPPNVPIERFQQVDGGLYRGAQPSAAGFKALRELGIRTVVNLRMDADARKTNEKYIVETLGMRYVHVPVEDGNFFTRSRTIPDAAIREFFAVLDQNESGPVFVHCHRGADRTGALVAFYRIARQGWDSQRALSEARQVGMRSWYRGLQNQIAEFSLETLQLIFPPRPM
jgi:protein tyrosine/serine phosphatase